ncbi:MAG: transcriptional repressor [Desulfobacterota bacterium]|nr:transcriptional repressor [Thermodesulfobacteriota bacterium]
MIQPRMTHQREIILQKLRSVTTHPTADEMYEMVRQHLPHISIATVYRNLEWLANNGYAQKIEVGGRQKRFDGTTQPHYHVRCLTCGRVDDVHIPVAPIAEGLKSRAEEYTGYVITGHSIEFTGYCSSCRHNKTKNGNAYP